MTLETPDTETEVVFFHDTEDIRYTDRGGILSRH
jgi:hypothetical protein